MLSKMLLAVVTMTAQTPESHVSAFGRTRTGWDLEITEDPYGVGIFVGLDIGF